jgi:hypothetical protein
MADQVGMDVGVGILDRVAHSRLCPEMHDPVEFPPLQRAVERGHVGEVDLDEAEAVVVPRTLLGDPVSLQLDAVIIVDVVDPEHLLAAAEQPGRDMMADEAGRAGHEDRHLRLLPVRSGGRTGRGSAAQHDCLSIESSPRT